MKARLTVYWVSTVLLCAFMAFAAISYLMRNPRMMESFASLGYPAYFPVILGVAKLLGVLALLVPGLPLLKEWAYAGFAFTCLGAFFSHLTVGQAAMLPMPVVALILLAASHATRPPARRAIPTPTVPLAGG